MTLKTLMSSWILILSSFKYTYVVAFVLPLIPRYSGHLPFARCSRSQERVQGRLRLQSVLAYGGVMQLPSARLRDLQFWWRKVSSSTRRAGRLALQCAITYWFHTKMVPCLTGDVIPPHFLADDSCPVLRVLCMWPDLGSK